MEGFDFRQLIAIHKRSIVEIGIKVFIFIQSGFPDIIVLALHCKIHINKKTGKIIYQALYELTRRCMK